jgi:hypothetical protein
MNADFQDNDFEVGRKQKSLIFFDCLCFYLRISAKICVPI